MEKKKKKKKKKIKNAIENTVGLLMIVAKQMLLQDLLFQEKPENLKHH